MRRLLATLLAVVPAVALAGDLPDGVYVSDLALCPAVVLGDYAAVSAADGLAVAPHMGMLGGSFRCNFAASAGSADTVEAKCLGPDGAYEDKARISANDGAIDLVSEHGRLVPNEAPTRLFRCEGVSGDEFPTWNGIEP